MKRNTIARLRSSSHGQALRAKEAKEFQQESFTAKTNIAGLDQAIPALRKVGSSFCPQTRVVVCAGLLVVWY